MTTPTYPPQSLWHRIEGVLPEASKPARYIGCEGNIIRKEPSPDMVRWLLVFPDTYEVGLPNLGIQILYELLNDRPDAQAERAYAPWTDMAAIMRREGIPLFSVDRHDPARAFDVLGFSFPSELLYTNLLECLDLAGIPLRACDRTSCDPLVIAGGHAVTNPEPIAPFVDAVVIGDGEEAVADITAVLRDLEETGTSRESRLEALAGIDGVYVPAFYAPLADAGIGGMGHAVAPLTPAAADRIEKRTVADLDAMPYPRHPLVPITEVVHDRLNVEVFRGCTRGCRFCQAGMITRPVRERDPQEVRRTVADGLAASGYEDVSLLSLSSADYSGIGTVLQGIMDDHGGDRVAVSLPSLRVDAFTVEIAAQVQRVKSTGLTFAPEAGTWRLRRVINKLVADDDLFAAVEAAYAAGWKRMKLYFMIGLPTETDEDVLAIAALAARCVDIGRGYHRGASVTISVGGFVPKAHTPFQWFGQNRPEELDRKLAILKAATRRSGIKLRWHDPAASAAEGIVSRGDRRVADVIEAVWRGGGVFQEWREHFRLDRWLEAMHAYDLDPATSVYRERGQDEDLPWDHIAVGPRREFLWDEWNDARAARNLEDCRWTPCYDCGICTDYGLEHRVGSLAPPAGGSQGTGHVHASTRSGATPVEFVESPRLAGEAPVRAS